MAELLPAFQARHPGIEVRVQQLPWTAAHEKLLTAYAGDALPDLCQLGNTWLPEFSALDALEPLDARVADAEHPARRLLRRHPRHQPHADARAATACSACRGTSTRALLFYRSDLLRAAGHAAAAAELGRVARRDARGRGSAAARGQLRRAAAAQRARPAVRARAPARPAARRRRRRAARSRSAPFRRALGFYAELFRERPRAGDDAARRSRTSGTSSRAACSRSTSPARGTSASSGAACRASARATGRPRRCRARTGRASRRPAARASCSSRARRARTRRGS